MIKLYSTNYKVFYEDTDSSGFVYHTTYFRLSERARSEFLINFFPEIIDQINRKKNFFVVKEINAEYLKPAFLFDMLKINTFFISNKMASFILKQDILRKEKTICSIKVKLVWIDAKTNSPIKLPENLISRFKLIEVV